MTGRGIPPGGARSPGRDTSDQSLLARVQASVGGTSSSDQELLVSVSERLGHTLQHHLLLERVAVVILKLGLLECCALLDSREGEIHCRLQALEVLRK